MGMFKNQALRESDIRPDSLMQGQKERLIADASRLLSYKNDFVYVSCPACDTKTSNKKFEKYGLSFQMCSNCETIYINPRPSPQILKNYYSTSENYRYWNKYIFPATEDARRNSIFRPRVERVAEICKSYKMDTDVLMDVGAGFGTFCEEVQRKGLFRRVIAVEPTSDLAETCRRKGLEVIEKPIEQVEFEHETIDIITNFEVIEHLFCPRSFLLGCSSVLKKKGLFIVTCPNVKGFDILTLGSLSDTVDVEHLNYFHPASLLHLLNTCGFEVLELLTPGMLDAELVRKKALNGEFDISTQPFLKRILIDEWEKSGSTFQEFLVRNQLSSNMWVIARKA